MPGPRKTSPVWELFVSTVGGMVKCKNCSRTYKYCGNTSTLMNHIKKNHPSEYCEIIEFHNKPSANYRSLSTVQIQNDNIGPALPPPLPPISSPSTSGPTPTKRYKQTRLTVPQKIVQKSGDDALIQMIVRDYQPLQIVENEVFRNYSRTLNSDYELPSRKKLTGTLEEKYNTEYAVYKKILQDVEHISLTSDIWMSDSNKSFVSVTAHFIQESKLRSIVICTSEIGETHTAENIANVIRQILDEWQINSKIVTIVTDNAA